MLDSEPHRLEEVELIQNENVELKICTLNNEQKASFEASQMFGEYFSSQENVNSQNIDLKDRRNFRQNVPDLSIKAPIQSDQETETNTTEIPQPAAQKKQKKETLPFSALESKPFESAIKAENCEVSMGRTNYLQIKILNKIMGDIVTPRLRTKKTYNGLGSFIQSLRDKNFLSQKGLIKREDIKEAFRTIDNNHNKKTNEDNVKLSTEYKSKFDFQKKKFQTLSGSGRRNCFRSPGLGATNTNVDPLEQEFLKTFEQTAKASYTPQQKTQSRSILTEHNETTDRISREETLRRTHTKGVLEDLLKNDFEDNYPKTLNDLDNKFSLPTLSDVGHRSLFNIGSPQHEKLTPILGNFSSLEKTGRQVNEKVIVIQINPPAEDTNSPIEEACPYMEESNVWSPPKQFDLAGCVVPQRRITFAYDVSNVGKQQRETFTYSERYGKMIKAEAIPSIENIDERVEKEKVGNGKLNVYRDFVKNVEEIFKFDDIYSCQLTNLNFKFQKIRIKSNFFTFLEKIMQHSIRGIHDSYTLSKLHPVKAIKPYKNNVLQLSITVQNSAIYSLETHYLSDFAREDILHFTKHLSLSSENLDVDNKEYTDDTKLLQHKLKKSQSHNLSLVGKPKIISPAQNYHSRHTIHSSPIVLFIGHGQIINMKKPYFKLGLADVKGLFNQFEESWPQLNFVFDMVHFLEQENSDFLIKQTFFLYRKLLRGAYESTLKLDSQRDLPQINKAPKQEVQEAPPKRAARRIKTYHEIPDELEEEPGNNNNSLSLVNGTQKFQRRLKRHANTMVKSLLNICKFKFIYCLIVIS